MSGEIRGEVAAVDTVSDNGTLLLDRIEASVGVLQETQASVVDAARHYIATADAVSEASAGLVEKTDDLLAKIDGFAEFKDATGPYMQEQAAAIAETRQNTADALEAVNLAKSMANQAGAKALNAESVATAAANTANGAEAKAESFASQIADNKTEIAALTQTVNDSTSGLAATKAIADSAKAVADAALPKSGGHMDGPITACFDGPVHSAQPQSITMREVYDTAGNCISRLYTNIRDNATTTSLASYWFDSDKKMKAETLLHLWTYADGKSYIGCNSPSNDSKDLEIVTASWARSHFIEQLTYTRVTSWSPQTTKTMPSGGTWAVFGYSPSNHYTWANVYAGGTTVDSLFDYAVWAFRVA